MMSVFQGAPWECETVHLLGAAMCLHDPFYKDMDSRSLKGPLEVMAI